MVKDIVYAKNVLLGLFPGLQTDPHFDVISEWNQNYNCIAWAMRLTDRWVDVTETAGHWWPIYITGTKYDISPQALIDAFSAMKFMPCSSGSVEKKYDKVALYMNPYYGNWTHAARLTDASACNSKIGKTWGIFHGGEKDRMLNDRDPVNTYGVIYAYMKRPKIYRWYSLWLMIRRFYDVIKSLRV